MIWKKYRRRNVSSKVLQLFKAENLNLYFSQVLSLAAYLSIWPLRNSCKVFRDFELNNCRKLNSSYIGRLKGTDWDNPQSIDLAVSNFERYAKRKVISIYLLIIVVPN